MPESTSSVPLILDTCVIQAMGNKNQDKARAVIEQLRELKKEYSFFISEVTVFENLQGLWGEKRQKALETLKRISWKAITVKVIAFASILGGLYHEEGVQSAGLADKIIASTAILLGGSVLTSDHQDFPNPFFKQERLIPVKFKKGLNFRTYDMSLFKPNNLLIKRILSEKMKLEVKNHVSKGVKDQKTETSRVNLEILKYR